jgi:hypothetical protein
LQEIQKTKTLIEELESDIEDALETVKLLRKTKRALEMRAFMLKYTPPKDAIKNACIRLGTYPKLTKNSELQDNGIKKSTKQDKEIDNIYQTCSASSDDNGT